MTSCCCLVPKEVVIIMVTTVTLFPATVASVTSAKSDSKLAVQITHTKQGYYRQLLKHLTSVKKQNKITNIRWKNFKSKLETLPWQIYVSADVVKLLTVNK